MYDLTVILLTYNRKEEYLRKSIEAVLRQSMKNFDFIVYDNGSTETDVEGIVSEYAGARLVKKEKNAPAYVHWNDFRDLAGEYLLVTHDDDIMCEDMIKREYETIISASDIKMTGCNVSIIDASDNELFERLFYADGEKTEFRQNELLRTFATDAWNVRPTYPCVMYRTSVLRQIDFSFFKTVGKGDDLYLMFSVDKLAGRSVILHDCLYKYRVHKNQDSRFAPEVLASGKKSLELLHGIVDEEEIEKRKRSFDIQVEEAKRNKEVRELIGLKNPDISEMLDIYRKDAPTSPYRYGYKQILFFAGVTAYLKDRNRDGTFEYVIWGLGSGGRKTRYLLDLWYPDSRCVLYLDSWQGGFKKDGIAVCRADEYSFDKKYFIFLCGGPEDRLKENGYRLIEDYLFGYNVI